METRIYNPNDKIYIAYELDYNGQRTMFNCLMTLEQVVDNLQLDNGIYSLGNLALAISRTIRRDDKSATLINFWEI